MNTWPQVSNLISQPTRPRRASFLGQVYDLKSLKIKLIIPLIGRQTEAVCFMQVVRVFLDAGRPSSVADKRPILSANLE